MNVQLAIVLIFLAVSVFIFATNRLRMDVVALLVIVAFAVNGKISAHYGYTPVLSISDTLAGFSDPNIILIAVLFVLGEGLVRTGIAYRIGELLAKKAGNSETKLILLLMCSVVVLGSFMSSTGVVAIFMPIALSVCHKMSISPARIMMPLSFAGLISGMMTLVATAPNLIVNSELSRTVGADKAFGFFSITPIGLLIFAAGILYMLVARRWLKDRLTKSESEKKSTMNDLVTAYKLQGKTFRFQLRYGSPMVDKNLMELGLRVKYGISVVGIERTRKFGQRIAIIPSSTTELRVNDILLITSEERNVDLKEFYTAENLDPLPLRGEYFSDNSKYVGMAEILINPTSALLGKTFMQMAFRNNYNVNVVAVNRKGDALDGDLSNVKINAGDTILVVGDWLAIRKMQTDKNLVLLNIPAEVEEVAPAMSQEIYAVAAVAVMIVLMVTGIVPNVIAALIACLIMGFFKCIDMSSAYKSIQWSSVILIVGMMPFAKALQVTGGVDLAVNGLINVMGGFGPHIMLMGLFVVCAVIGLFISNTATAVLVAPIAIGLASQLGLSPYPFAMTVTIAASAAFMTPVSSPVNTLVLTPGGYNFMDYVKIGVPFTIMVMLITVFVVPLLFPF